jgi:hypothetical protein
MARSDEFSGRVFGTVRILRPLTPVEIARGHYTPRVGWYATRCTRCGLERIRRANVLARESVRTDPPFLTGCSPCSRKVLDGHLEPYKRKVLALRAKGWTYQRIGAAVGRSKARVYQVCKRAKLTTSPLTKQ